MATISPLYQPRPYQIPLLKAFDEGCKRLFHIWHRRCGKDLTDLNIVVAEMATTVGNYYYFLPTYSQAKKVIWEGKTKDGTPFLDFFPKELIAGKPNDTELKIKFKNGSLFQLIGSDNIDSIVGTNPRGCVFSEFPLQDPKAWNYMRPILAENGGWAIFNGTPRGKNHAWDVMVMAKDSPNWFVEVLTVEQTNAITKEALADEKKEMPQDLYEQEYYCKFIDGAGQFFRRIKQNTYPKDMYRPENGDFQIGADLAQYQDWTVLTPFNLNHFVAYPQERFNNIDWNLQKARIEAMARRHTALDTLQTALIWPDSTGVGSPITQDLVARGLRVGGDDSRGFVFTETSRTNLLDNLAILLEQDKIKIPDEEGLVNELESFRYTMSERGKIKVSVPDGKTDDRVMSLALSVWGVREPVRPNPDMLLRVQRNRETNRSFK